MLCHFVAEAYSYSMKEDISRGDELACAQAKSSRGISASDSSCCGQNVAQLLRLRLPHRRHGAASFALLLGWFCCVRVLSSAGLNCLVLAG